MGFYSIYKIIKDMLHTLFGNKILKFIIIFILIFSCITIYNKVFCVYSDSLTTVTLNNSQYDIDINYLTKDYNYYFLCWSSKQSGSKYYNYLDLFCSNHEMTFDINSTYSTTTVNTPYNSGFIRFHLNISSSVNNFSSVVSNWNATHFIPSLNTHTYTNSNTLLIEQTVTRNNSSYVIYNITLANYDVKDSNNNIIFNNNVFFPPTLSNTQTQLENLAFPAFIINANSFTQNMINDSYKPLVMLFYNRSLSNSSSTEGLYPIKEKYFYKQSIFFDSDNSTDSNYIFKYPIFKTGILFNVGSTYEIRFATTTYNEEFDTTVYEYLGDTYTFTINSDVTQDYINQLNQQTALSTDEDNSNQQLSAINQQTQSIDNLNNTITDSSVDSSSIELPTDNTQDPTQSAVDNIFQTIYNSFTSGTAQDIVFPVPFTNKNITLQANYLYNALQNNNASWIITIIQAFWWYIISRFIITDIMRKIRKIKQGNFDNIQNSNIKEDML